MAARTSKVLRTLSAHESRNVTFIDPDGAWPIVWERARGVHVWDIDGHRYLDLTAAFGVAAAGHANPAVVRAGQQQMRKLLHAMGDVHPHAGKANLARELSRITYGRWQRGTAGKVIFCSSGFEAVEAALKTALLATGKRGVIAFEGGYHGLGYGALNATHREHFRNPFKPQLGQFGAFIPFPSAEGGDLAGVCTELERALREGGNGAVIVEPFQARGGIRIPPPEFLPMVRKLCDQHGALLILDEIYTGFGRTGRWFACEHSGVVPDLICLGKALTGGFPLSACVGRAGLMDEAWPAATGEAIHTSTFLGHPVGCAMALANIAEIRSRRLVQKSEATGRFLLDELRGLAARTFPVHARARGIGLMAGFEVTEADGKPATGAVLRAMKRMLRRGFIILPEGEHGNVLGFTPPLTISPRDLQRSIRTLGQALMDPA